MKKIFYVITVLFTVQELSAQTPEDAIRMSWNPASGTARNQAIGGAAGSLGGDISSMFVNPAGLGFYKTNEFVLSPSWYLLNGSATYRGTKSNAESMSKFTMGTSGFVWGEYNPRSRWSNRTFSIGINRSANFNGVINYEGANNYSSFSESFAEEFANSGLPVDVRLYDAPLTLGTKLAVYNLLIDTATTNNGLEIVGIPLLSGIVRGRETELMQRRQVETSGGATEIAFGFAANKDDKLYLGGSIGLPIMNYRRSSLFTEWDPTKTLDSFALASYEENYRVQGVGVNAKLGMIVKASDNIRAGLSIHTPTLYGLREKTTGRMFTDLEKYYRFGGNTSEADEHSIYTDNNVAVPEYRYDLVSPWKFLVSGSYMINAVQDVTQQKGFITADVEYVTHGSSRFTSAESVDDDAYYDGVNDGIKLLYKGAVNVRVGGELKFNTLMTRLGFSYYGSPYRDSELKGRRMNISGGLGYRNKGIFVDLAYVHGLNKDVDFPYRLADKANTFAETSNHNGNVLLTFGVKF